MSTQNRSTERTAAQVPEQCRVCGSPVLITINRGTGVCSERCAKAEQAVKGR